MIDTIMLDLDGPILDGRFRHYQCYSDILVEHGYTPIPLNKYWEMKRRKIDRYQQLAASGADGIYDIFLKTWLERIENEHYLALDRIQPGAVQKLQEWKHDGIRLIVITLRNNNTTLRRQLDSLSISPLFERIISLDTMGDSNSKANAVRNLIEDMESVLWIGDTEVDIFSARSLGVKVCALGCGLRTEEYLATLNPDYLVFDLTAVNIAQMGAL